MNMSESRLEDFCEHILLTNFLEYVDGFRVRAEGKCSKGKFRVVHAKQMNCTLIDFGIPDGDTAMARTVGTPAAVGARMILEGKIDLTGVHIPVRPEIYEPILNELERQGIAIEEREA